MPYTVYIDKVTRKGTVHDATGEEIRKFGGPDPKNGYYTEEHASTVRAIEETRHRHPGYVIRLCGHGCCDQATG